MAGEYAHNVLSGKSTKKDMAERQLDADEKSFADSADRFIAGKRKVAHGSRDDNASRAGTNRS